MKLSNLSLSLFLSVKPRKGSAGHKHRLEVGAHGKCRLCSALQSSPVCGSDGHTYSSEVRNPFSIHLPSLLPRSLYFSSHFKCVILFSSVIIYQLFSLFSTIKARIASRRTAALEEPLNYVIYGVNISDNVYFPFFFLIDDTLIILLCCHLFTPLLHRLSPASSSLLAVPFYHVCIDS